MKKALFSFTIYNYFREMLPVAEFFHQQGIHICALIGWTGETADECRRRCEESGFEVLLAPGVFSYHEPDNKAGHLENEKVPGEVIRRKNTGLRNFLLKIVRWQPSLGVLLASISHVSASRRVVKYARSILSAINPDVFFAGPFHSCGRIDNALLKTCNSRKIKSFCLSVSAYWGENQAVYARFNNLRMKMLSTELLVENCLASRIIANVFPKWVRSWDGLKFFIHPPSQMLAAFATGMLEDNPWQKPSDRFDSVFAESDFSRDMLIQSHYAPEKVIVSGKPLLDVVFQRMGDASYRDRLYSDLGLEPNEPFILFNVEPSAEHHYESWEVHWRHFHELMDGLFQFNKKVILSLHPLCNLTDYLFVEKKYGFIVSKKYKIAELYPYCQLVVSFPCSTNTFSKIFKKRIIIYDWYGLTKASYHMHKIYRFRGAEYVYGKEMLVDTLKVQLSSFDWSGEDRYSIRETMACEKIYREVTHDFNPDDVVPGGPVESGT